MFLLRRFVAACCLSAMISAAFSQAEPIKVPPAADGLADDLGTISRMDRDLEKRQRQLQSLQLDLQIRQTQQELQGETIQAPSVPPLVGIKGSDGDLSAEFLVSNGLRTAREGDYVTAQWQVERIVVGQVDIKSVGGNSRHTLLLGQAAPGSGPYIPTGPVIPPRQTRQGNAGGQ